MGTGAAGALSSSSSAYVGWKEVFVSSAKGRKEVHYYLKKRDGASDLAVVGKEKSPRHMRYFYAVQDMFVLVGSSPSLFLKLRSRREVVDWLDSIVQECHAAVDTNAGFGSFDERDAGFLSFGRSVKDVKMQNDVRYKKPLSWLGSSWTCKKKRKHYQAFCRNGFNISVNDFVFVMAEDSKRLVAHLEDMYEDLQGNKMVLVRWFHRIDEVDIDLPHKFSDREIFFSLCLQDVNIECIDGIATVLSPLHLNKYSNEARDSWFQPFVCEKLFEDCDMKPFDITQVKGYWTQEILRRMFTTSLPKNDKDLANLPPKAGPRKRLRLLRDSRSDVLHGCRKSVIKNSSCFNGKSHIGVETRPSFFAVGHKAEVLSQDSGLRGCWFRATIIKKHKDKIKVRYQDVQDADDESKNLEEWVSSSRIACDDHLSLRINGRTTVRPFLPQPHSGIVSWAFDIGSLVDAWWHDGWWEGIVIRRESDEKVQVYFPGERREAIFCLGELRHSQEWFNNKWKDLHGRADVATELSSHLTSHGGESKATSSGNSNIEDSLFQKFESCSSDSRLEDLSKDEFLAQLQWKRSRKRTRSGHYIEKAGDKEPKKNTKRSSQNFLAQAPAKLLKVDLESCKYIVGDPLFNSSVAPPIAFSHFDRKTTSKGGGIAFMLCLSGFRLSMTISMFSARLGRTESCPLRPFKYCCMMMRVSVDCKCCQKKLRRILLGMKEVETHMIDRQFGRVSVCGRFRPSDVAVKVQKCMNRRVGILEIQEFDGGPGGQPQYG